MDLRAPLHLELDGSCSHYLDGDNNGIQYENIMHNNLCRMYISARAMEIGSESRFTGMILFHRYARQFLRLVHHEKMNDNIVDEKRSVQATIEQFKSHLGPVAAACLFLGCKMEEEPRRIRDVINLSHVLNFSSWGDGIEGNETTTHPSGRSNKPINVIEATDPPPLDESYWSAKEQTISTEQHVLRMIQFDTIVCHPHRCVLIIMETLNFGAGENMSDEGKSNDANDGNWLLNGKQSEQVILRSWRILNEASLDAKGRALCYSVMVLSCASISLAAAGSGIVINRDESDADDGKRVTLPDFWWRAVDVSTKDIMAARDALQKVLQENGSNSKIS